MAKTPCAILLITTSMRIQAEGIVDAMAHGACDVVEAPLLSPADFHDVARPLLEKIDRLAPRGRRALQGPNPSPRLRLGSEWLVAIGASAGGPAVVSALLRQLPKDFPAAVVIVQHLARQFVEGLVGWLNGDSSLPVRIAQEGERPMPGSVVLAGQDAHLTFKPGALLGYTPEPADAIHRPSVDVFFHSICTCWQGRAVGVLLTGMGRDGAVGLKALRECGHRTIAQDQVTSAVYGMPKAAASLQAAVDILPADRIAPTLLEIVTCRRDNLRM